MPLSIADHAALSEALHTLKIDPVEGVTLRAILAIDTSQPNGPDRLQTLWDYVTNPANPGSSVITIPKMTSQDFNAMLLAADLVVQTKTADVQATYDRFSRKLANLVTVDMTDDAVVAFIAFCTEHNLITQDRLDEKTKVRVSLAETAIGRVPDRVELSSVCWADDGTALL